jgi:hypothetical protein
MNSLTKLKISGGLFLVVALIAVAYFMSAPRAAHSGADAIDNGAWDSAVKNPIGSVKPASTADTAGKTQAITHAPDQHAVAPITSNEVVTVAGNPAQAAIVKRWMDSRGHYGPDDDSLNEYKAYDLETLERLAETGDLKAMSALSWLYLSNERYGRPDSLVKYENILHRAAVYGSTAAFGKLSRFSINLEPGTGAVKYEDLIEGFAWAHVATLRGDMLPSNSALVHAGIHQFEFTDKAAAQIKNRAHELYNQLEKQRIEMGLGKFDNSRPPEVDNLFKNLGGFMPIPE